MPRFPFLRRKYPEPWQDSARVKIHDAETFDALLRVFKELSERKLKEYRKHHAFFGPSAARKAKAQRAATRRRRHGG